MDDTSIKKYKLEIQKLFLNIIGKEINKGKTKASIAKTIGISPSLISKYISGERIPSEAVIKRVIELYRIPEEDYRNIIIIRNNIKTKSKRNTEKEELRFITHEKLLKILEYIETQTSSHVEMAKRLGITQVSLSRYFSGERIPKAIFVEKMIDTFNIPNEVYKEYSDIELEHDEGYEILRHLGIKEILDILKSLNIDQKEISKRTGLTEANVSRYYHGTRNPRESYSRLIYKKFEPEIVDYCNHTLFKKIIDDNSFEKSSDKWSDESYKSFLSAVKSLPNEDKKLVFDLVKSLVEKNYLKNNNSLSLKMTNK